MADSMKQGGKLTIKQQRFVEYYDGNATKAALRAGYKKNTAAFTGAENLRKPQIQKAIQSREKKNSRSTLLPGSNVKHSGQRFTMIQSRECRIGSRLLSCLVALTLILLSAGLSRPQNRYESSGRIKMQATEEYKDVVINYKPHAGQYDFHDSPARFRVLACGTRWGKERCCVPEMINIIATRQAQDSGRAKRNYVPNIHWWAVGPTYGLTNQLWNELKYFTPKDLIASVNETNRCIKWKDCYGGALIEMKTAQDPETLVSVGLDGVLITEAGLLKRQVWEDSIRPRLSSRNGVGIINGTPRGRWESHQVKSFLYQAYLNGQDPQLPEWSSWNFPTWNNPYISPLEIESMHKEMDERLFQQNIGAKFLDFALGKPVFGTVWNDAMIRDDVYKSWNKRYTVLRGWDRGYHYPACNWSFINGEDQWCIAKEMLGHNLTRNQFIGQMLEKTRAWFPEADIIDYPPPDCAQVDSDGYSWLQIMRSHGIKPMKAKAGKDEIVRRTDAVRQHMVLRDDGKFGMVVDSSCRILTEGFQGAYCYPEVIDKPEDEKPVKDGYYDHLQDSLAVVADNHFGAFGAKNALKTIRLGVRHV